jgi:GT2 family glycosyltransferase
MALPTVTIVVPPRDRFNRTRPSLESIYRNTDYPFDLVYVDGNSPPHVKRYLEGEVRTRGFRLIRTDRYLSPNQARNIGLKEVRTKYVVFVDNDVEVAPRWLTFLVECAEQTGAWAVAPLIFEGPFNDQVIHIFGGTAEFSEKDGVRTFHEEHLFNGRRLDQVQTEMRRMPTGFAEFHCVLLPREVFDTLGPCDERLLSLEEHLDLSLLIRQAGGTVYVEPRAHVAFPYEDLLDASDMEYARLRWSDDWNRRSAQRFVEKWKVDPGSSWQTQSIDWGNNHREHLERLRRSPWSMLKRLAKEILPEPAYKALQALRN